MTKARPFSPRLEFLIPRNSGLNHVMTKS
jgi:hypothetical protein